MVVRDKGRLIEKKQSSLCRRSFGSETDEKNDFRGTRKTYPR